MQPPNAILSGSDAFGDMHGDRFLRRCISQMHSVARTSTEHLKRGASVTCPENAID